MILIKIICIAVFLTSFSLLIKKLLTKEKVNYIKIEPTIKEVKAKNENENENENEIDLFDIYKERIVKKESHLKGESLVTETIKNRFNKNEYHLFNNITLRLGEITTQIDHLLVCKFGVFIIETKHFSGWIYANSKSKKWTQVIFRAKNQFQNPIHQNYKHVLAVKENLEFIDKKTFHNVVVFTGDGEFKTKKPFNVFFLDELIDFISSKEKEVLTDDDILKAIGKIEKERYFISEKTDIEHVEMLNKRFK